MDSYEKQGLDEDAFGDKGLSGLRTFDAFRMAPTECIKQKQSINNDLQQRQNPRILPQPKVVENGPL